MNTARSYPLPERTACEVLDINRQTVRNCRRKQAFVGPRKPRHCVAQAQQPRALKDQERRQVLDILNSDQYADQLPAQVYYDLLSQGEYCTGQVKPDTFLKKSVSPIHPLSTNALRLLGTAGHS